MNPLKYRSTLLQGALALLMSSPTLAQSNLDFEDTAAVSAWNVEADASAIVIDTDQAFSGRQSLRINGRGRATQTIPAGAISGNRIRLTAQLRTDAVINGSAGLWLRVDGKQARLYIDVMRSRGATGHSDWTQYTLEAPIGPEAQRVTFGVQLRGSGTAWFDALSLEDLDTRSRPLPSADAAHYLDYALDLIEANSLMRRSIDWPRWRATTIDQARGAQAPADTHLALSYALGALEDGHSYLMTPEQSDRLSSTPVANARTGQRLVVPRGVPLTDTIGYVSLPGYAGGTQAQQVEFAASVHAIIADLDHAGLCGWIVDLRDNTGGNLWPMLAAVGPLLGDGEAGAALHADGSAVPFWYRRGRAGLGDFVQLRVPTPAYETGMLQRPVAVLIGPRTASSGEVIAAAFRGRANTASFGAPTRGLSTGNRTFPLRDDAALVLTVAATRDPAGQVHAGPLQPDHGIEPDSRRTMLSESASVHAAVQWLNTLCRAGSQQG